MKDKEVRVCAPVLLEKVGYVRAHRDGQGWWGVLLNAHSLGLFPAEKVKQWVALSVERAQCFDPLVRSGSVALLLLMKSVCL